MPLLINLITITNLYSDSPTDKTPKLKSIPVHKYQKTLMTQSGISNPLEPKVLQVQHGSLRETKTYFTGLFHKKTDAFGGFSYFVPHNTDFTEPVCLVIGLHGLNQTAQQYISIWINSAFQNGFIILCPQSSLPGGKWHIKDEKRILQLLNEFTLTYNIDPNKVLLSGFSEGAHFAYLLGLNHFDKFTALNTICGKIRNAWEGLIFFSKDSNKHLPIFSINGKEDPYILEKEILQSWEKIEDFGYPHSTWLIDNLDHNHYPYLNTAILAWFEQLLDNTSEKKPLFNK